MTQKGYPKKKTKIIWKGFIIRLVIIFFVVIFSYAGYFGYKFYRLEKKVVWETENIQEGNKENYSTLIQTAKNIITNEKKELKGEEQDRINILLLGMGGEGHKGKYLTDTIMLVSINPKTYQSAFLSIPRDLYVNIPETYIYTKINAVYAYELQMEKYQQEDKQSENQSSKTVEDNQDIEHNQESSAKSMSKLKQTIKEITGQEVDYYIALDFEGFKKIIDELGGINIEVEEDIYDSRYPGLNYSYETFEIKKGQHLLDGETALKYARVRHTTGGDFGRAKRQQQVLASAKRKAFSLSSFVNPIHLNNLINILGENLKTDIHFNEIPAFINLAEKINIYQTTNKVLDAWSEDSLLASSHVPLGGVMAYVLIPKARNYSQIHELSENIFDLEAIRRKKENIEKEEAKIIVYSENYRNDYKIENIFSHWGYKIKMDHGQEFLNDCQNQNIIFNNSRQEAKIFTLDDLSDKLGIEIKEQDIEKEENIFICLNQEAFDYYDKQNLKQEEEKDELKEKSVIDERGNILINQKNQKQVN